MAFTGGVGGESPKPIKFTPPTGAASGAQALNEAEVEREVANPTDEYQLAETEGFAGADVLFEVVAKNERDDRKEDDRHVSEGGGPAETAPGVPVTLTPDTFFNPFSLGGDEIDLGKTPAAAAGTRNPVLGGLYQYGADEPYADERSPFARATEVAYSVPSYADLGVLPEMPTFPESMNTLQHVIADRQVMLISGGTRTLH